MQTPETPSAIMRTSVETAQTIEKTYAYKAQKKCFPMLFSAVVAGVFISIAFAFYITVTIGGESIPYGISKFIGGICFSLGLTLVVIFGVDLFTSTVLNVVPKASNKITWGSMFYNWLTVYIGNFIGALIFVAIIWFANQHLAANGQWGLNVLKVASHKLESSFVGAMFLGILANLMVCLAVWMSASGKTLVDKMLIMMFPVAMFVASGFEHSIANMFMVPLGIIINTYASPEFWTMTNSTSSHFSQLTIGNFITCNLIPVTIGNIIGGAMVGLTFWWINLRKINEH